MTNSDNRQKVWGRPRASLSPFDLNALNLKYALHDLVGVKGRVLDVGCGAGGLSKAIKHYRPDLKVFGVDVSEEEIAVARKKPEGIRFVHGDVSKLKRFSGNYFDAVVMFNVLEHLDNPGQALGEISRVLKPKAVFSSLTPLDGSVFTIHGAAKRLGFVPKKKYAGHVQQFDEAEVTGLFAKAKLNIYQKRYSQHLFFQFIDFFYFSLLYLRGKNTRYSVETYLSYTESGSKVKILKAVKSLIAVLSYYESALLKPFPGLGLHLTARKG